MIGEYLAPVVRCLALNFLMFGGVLGASQPHPREAEIMILDLVILATLFVGLTVVFVSWFDKHYTKLTDEYRETRGRLTLRREYLQDLEEEDAFSREASAIRAEVYLLTRKLSKFPSYVR
jgi:hypothetical protein